LFPGILGKQTGQLHRLSVTTVPNFVCATWTRHRKLGQFPVSPEVWLEQFWIRVDDLFANFLGPGYKYWGALATACGLCPHIPHRKIFHLI